MKSTDHSLFALHRIGAALLGLGLSLGAAAQPAGGTAGSGTTTAPAAGSMAAPDAARTGAARNASPALATGDRKFVEHAALGGMAEVQLGKLAQDKAAHDQVKQFGARMVQDHGKANDELMSIAKTKAVQPPTALDRKHQRDMERLQKLNGAEFDRAYMSHMVDDHKKDVADFKKQANAGKDADLKAFAAKTLPTLQEHLQLAQSTQAALKSDGKTNGGRNTPRGPAAGASGASR